MLGYPVKVKSVRHAKKCKTCNLGYIIVSYAINRQTKGRNYTNFESNLAMMVMYLNVKFEFNWTKRF